MDSFYVYMLISVGYGRISHGYGQVLDIFLISGYILICVFEDIQWISIGYVKMWISLDI
jgi:hypothetical protein